MGRGDKKTGKGKRAMGSFGNSRPKKKSTNTVTPEPKKAEKKAAAPKKETAAKKPVAKKTTAAKKPAAKKEAKTEEK